MGKWAWVILMAVLAVTTVMAGGIAAEEITAGDTLLEWSYTYGGAKWDMLRSFLQTADGGYALFGRTDSFGEGGTDYWLVKTDSSGAVTWNQTYGGEDDDWGDSFVQTADGGFLLAGTRNPRDPGARDHGWLVKTDSKGVMQWDQTIGKDSGEELHANVVLQAQNGSLVIAGTKGISASFPWLVKVDANGTLLWDQSYITGNHPFIYSMIQTADGGFLLVGSTYSGQNYLSDIMLLKTGSDGTQQWNRTIGSDNFEDHAYSVIQTQDGGFALAGETGVMGFGASVMWLIKTDSTGNPSWNQTYRGIHVDQGVTLIQQAGGGFIVAGNTDSFGAGKFDIWVVETDATGEKLRDQTFGGKEDDRVVAVLQKSDGGLVMAGNIDESWRDSDIWLFSTTPDWWQKRTTGVPGLDFLLAVTGVTVSTCFSRRKRKLHLSRCQKT